MGKKVYSQSAVLPYRLGKNGVEILLVTTSSGKKWTIPKGNIDPGMSAAQSAVKEAYEEAGIRGILSEESLGRFTYGKHGSNYSVAVFAFEVTEMLSFWPEDNFRYRQWMSLKVARNSVKYKDLRRLLKDVGATALFRDRIPPL